MRLTLGCMEGVSPLSSFDLCILEIVCLHHKMARRRVIQVHDLGAIAQHDLVVGVPYDDVLLLSIFENENTTFLGHLSPTHDCWQVFPASFGNGSREYFQVRCSRLPRKCRGTRWSASVLHADGELTGRVADCGTTANPAYE